MKNIFILCLFVVFVIYSVDALTCTGKTKYEVAMEVIRGDWGNGQTRRENFRKYCLQYTYEEIQNLVNCILYGGAYC